LRRWKRCTDVLVRRVHGALMVLLHETSRMV
jgi:hypothetical protein